ncbi:MAG: hypothetical protein JJ869_02930 [Marivita sp.]|uniref:hypothetical protein n=1 Tax=Marivita sp. TaxID=2003365 RepID=UPI001B175C11|nr:hypothetical protein [Marivita sp.]MBO6882519.1 hypothetical protein [Marivita sp.]
MNRFMSFALAAALTLPFAAQADEISDTLQSAIEAYNDGDITYALEELDFARQKLMALRTEAFQQFLPEAPDGWTREVDSDMQAGLAMMGGGMGANADYRSADGSQYYSISMMADNAMVASMGAMVANAAAMRMKVERVGRQRVAINDGQAMALVNNPILITIEGGDEALLMQAMEGIDFDALSNFGN